MDVSLSLSYGRPRAASTSSRARLVPASRDCVAAVARLAALMSVSVESTPSVRTKAATRTSIRVKPPSSRVRVRRADITLVVGTPRGPLEHVSTKLRGASLNDEAGPGGPASRERCWLRSRLPLLVGRAAVLGGLIARARDRGRGGSLLDRERRAGLG